MPESKAFYACPKCGTVYFLDLILDEGCHFCNRTDCHQEGFGSRIGSRILNRIKLVEEETVPEKCQCPMRQDAHEWQCQYAGGEMTQIHCKGCDAVRYSYELSHDLCDLCLEKQHARE